MLLGMWLNVAWMALVAGTAVALLVWGWRRGQFRDVEQAKYRMLEEKEPAPWPGRKRRDRGADDSKNAGSHRD